MRIRRFLLLTFPAFILLACVNKKNMLYFQGAVSANEANKSYSPIIKPDDLLSITVVSLDEAAAKPFNLPVSNVNQAIGGYVQGAPTPPGYLVNEKGEIDFPVIGKIKMAGLKRDEAVELLKENLKPYLKECTVIMRILNYKVTVLGEVRNPGTFTIPNERVTLPEALGIAGDLLITAQRKNIIVIRENEGKRSELLVDLTNKNVFSSPAYYLQQNDVVYVQPNRAKMNSSAVNTANIGLVVSVISLFVTIAILFRQ